MRPPATLPAPGGLVCVTGTAGAAGVHLHTYLERVTARYLVLRRRPDGTPHRYRRHPPHTNLPPTPWGPHTLAGVCQRPRGNA